MGTALAVWSAPGLAMLLLVLTALPSESGAWAPAQVTQPTLNWQPRSDWVNAKTHCGAAGNGVADDAPGINKCLRNMTSGSTLYLPPGTYRLTETLLIGNNTAACQHNNRSMACSGWESGFVKGHGAATVLVWDGPVNGTMMWSHGCTMCRFTGMHFDGKHTASYGFLHMSNMKFEDDIVHEVSRYSNFRAQGIAINPNGVTLTRVASDNILFRNLLVENCPIGIGISSFNDYDNTIEGCLFRNNDVGVYVGAGNAYIRNTRFENSSTVDMRLGWVWWLVHSVHRVVSAGSNRFITGGGGISIMDCHVESWFGGGYGSDGTNQPDWNWTSHAGEGWYQGGGAVSPMAQTQMLDSTFTNPRCNRSDPSIPLAARTWLKNSGAQCVAFLGADSGGDINHFPVLLSNNTITDGFSLVDHEGAGRWESQSNTSEPLLYNHSSAGKCPATGITAATNFYRSTWAIPTQVIEIGSYLPANGSRTPDEVTAAVQSCIDAASKAGAGAMCYFPPGVYPISSTVTLSGRGYYVGGAGDQSEFEWHGPTANESSPDPLAIGAVPTPRNN